MNYDCLILLGTEPDLKTWEFPKQIHDCLQTTANLIEAGVSEKVIVSGKWSRKVEDQNLGQPFDECDKMTDLLTALGVKEKMLLRERDSTDTISNLYYVKKQFLIPMKLEKVLFIVAGFRIPRLDFLVRKVLGPAYEVGYKAIDGEEGPSYNEARTMERTEKFLAPMRDGDHEWLTDKFFGDPFYVSVTKKNLAAMSEN